jgi:hypothetical protein
MSERSPNLSSVDVFVEWAKARLDEMGANVKVSDFGKVGQASWAAMSLALEGSRNAFTNAIEATAKKLNDAAMS